jgi:hypothetical protein
VSPARFAPRTVFGAGVEWFRSDRATSSGLAVGPALFLAAGSHGFGARLTGGWPGMVLCPCRGPFRLRLTRSVRALLPIATAAA